MEEEENGVVKNDIQAANAGAIQSINSIGAC
jgi:hypothetical protein